MGELREKANELELLRLSFLFERDALHEKLEDKRYLCDQIEEFTNFRIKSTKLLYYFDSLNRTNFHEYIDNIPYICVVIRTTKNHLLAGFTIQPFN